MPLGSGGSGPTLGWAGGGAGSGGRARAPPCDAPILAAKASVKKVMATVMSAQKGKTGVLLESMMGGLI